jgi:inner membrane protein
MDNLTHSVVGLGIGALIDRSLDPEPDAARASTRGRLLLAVGCLASNFPDLDLFATPLLEQPLGYLLMHRGHTHTLVGALLEMALLLGLVWLLWPDARRLLVASRPARTGALLAAGAGLALHIAMDGLNVYGVHPFWPFDGRWIYGDMVFIVEPVFWVAFGVPLAMLTPRRRTRGLLLGALALVLAGFYVKHFLQPGSLAGLLALGAVLAWIACRTNADTPGHRGRKSLFTGLLLALAFVGVQASALQGARAIVAAQTARLDAGERLLDVALSAYPSNPLCWSVVTVARDLRHDSYRLRRGILGIAPGVSPVTACPARIAGPVPSGNAQLAWTDDLRQSLTDLRRADRTNCHLHAWMRFARAPALLDGSATDARWSPPDVRNFSTIDYADLAKLPCTAPVPRWGVPRADLLTDGPTP